MSAEVNEQAGFDVREEIGRGVGAEDEPPALSRRRPWPRLGFPT